MANKNRKIPFLKSRLKYAVKYRKTTIEKMCEELKKIDPYNIPYGTLVSNMHEERIMPDSLNTIAEYLNVSTGYLTGELGQTEASIWLYSYRIDEIQKTGDITEIIMNMVNIVGFSPRQYKQLSENERNILNFYVYDSTTKAVKRFEEEMAERSIKNGNNQEKK